MAPRQAQWPQLLIEGRWRRQGKKGTWPPQYFRIRRGIKQHITLIPELRQWALYSARGKALPKLSQTSDSLSDLLSESDS